MKMIDLTGQCFGKLVVICQAPSHVTPNGTKKTMWALRCDCGNFSKECSQQLRKGHRRSCGCVPTGYARGDKGMQGRKYGRLTAIRREEARGKTVYWRFLCDCGRECISPGHRVRSGETKSCGCLQRESASRTKPVVKYRAAHVRVDRSRGPARKHPCVDCGGAARDWSYDGGDPNELYGQVGPSLLAYSLDVSLYSPRCPQCHGHYDAIMARDKRVAA